LKKGSGEKFGIYPLTLALSREGRGKRIYLKVVNAFVLD
jgi:hypothetical protein